MFCLCCTLSKIVFRAGCGDGFSYRGSTRGRGFGFFTLFLPSLYLFLFYLVHSVFPSFSHLCFFSCFSLNTLMTHWSYCHKPYPFLLTTLTQISVQHLLLREGGWPWLAIDRPQQQHRRRHQSMTSDRNHQSLQLRLLRRDSGKMVKVSDRIEYRTKKKQGIERRTQKLGVELQMQKQGIDALTSVSKCPNVL